ncbi:MAG TPA: NB-ARC domain-containing protein, partial [Thermomicrobiales bacterium]|nr:NB-ARC domain-containing protein [Thermomicrobiales bacterium]
MSTPEQQSFVIARDNFFGREDETRDILTLLARPDLACLTVLGPGGVGKTRLLTHVANVMAHDRREPFPDGIWFVPLATVTDPDRVPPVIALGLGLELTDEPAAVTVIEFLREREALLILDNVEQVIEVAPFVAEIAVACRDVKIVVTSRRPLRISGEQEYVLAPFPLPAPGDDASAESLVENPAVALFIQRAQRVNPLLQFDVRTLNYVAEICRSLDGLPLAIELAGARTKALSPAALATQLGHRLRVLTGRPRDAPARQQTLRSAIAWSYDLLSPHEQSLFRRLAIFTGGFGLNAVEALEDGLADRRADGNDSPPSRLPASPPVLDTIAALVDHSLVQPSETDLDEPHWTMLQTIQEFGIDALAAAGETHDLRRAHARVYAEMAANAEVAFYGKGQAALLTRLTAEESNIRAALEWSLDNGERELALKI